MFMLLTEFKVIWSDKYLISVDSADFWNWFLFRDRISNNNGFQTEFGILCKFAEIISDFWTVPYKTRRNPTGTEQNKELKKNCT